jgi:hypothetical protein
MPFKDPKRRNEYRKWLYQRDRKKNVMAVRARKRELGKWFFDYKKNLKCEMCGENHPATIDFHHKNGEEKDNGVSYFVYNGYSVKRVIEEIEKCQILCANCHRKVHFKNNKV